MNEIVDHQIANFQLPAKLNTAAAESLFEGFQTHRGASLTVNAADVTHLGTLCAQVIISARNTWEAEKQDFSVAECSDAFLADLERLGIPTHLFFEGE